MITSIKSSTVANRSSAQHSVKEEGIIYGSCTIFISNKDFAVQDFIVPQNIEDHLLIKILRGGLKSDFHATALFRLQIDISTVGIISTNLQRKTDALVSMLLTEAHDLNEFQLTPILPQGVALKLVHRSSFAN